MLRDHVLGRRGMTLTLVAWGVIWLAAPRVADAAPVPPSLSSGVPVSPADRDRLDRLERLLEDRLVRAQLQAAGVSEEDARAVLARLTPEERAELSRRADELAVGGDSTVIAVLAIALIIVALVILVLELLGRRVISRP